MLRHLAPPTLLTLVTLSFAPMAAPVIAQKGTVTPAGFVLPKTARKALDERFKGWALAAIDPQASACNTGGGETPAFVQADFNSDDQPDIAMAVKTANGIR